MKLILIRHGETYANALYHTPDRILIGALDSPLTELNETGRLQALSTRNKLEGIHVDEVYCSDLTRTRQTASIIFGEREIHYTPLLRERSLGKDEGQRVDIVFADSEAWKYHVDYDKDTLEECLSKKVIDGENYLMVIDRCREFLNKLDFNEDRTIAVVAHFHLLRCLCYLIQNKPIDKEIYQLLIPNAEPMFFEFIQCRFVHQNQDYVLKIPADS